MQHYATSDLYFSAYLQASGFKLLEIRPNGTRKVMVFEMSIEEGEKETTGYYNGEEINAVDYANHIKNIKNMISNTR